MEILIYCPSADTHQDLGSNLRLGDLDNNSNASNLREDSPFQHVGYFQLRQHLLSPALRPKEEEEGFVSTAISSAAH
jgi:hypothetical protein